MTHRRFPLSRENCKRIIIRNRHGKVALDWRRPPFGSLILRRELGRVWIERIGLFNRETYTVNHEQSIQTID